MMYAAQMRELKSLIDAYTRQKGSCRDPKEWRELDDKIDNLETQLRQTEELAFRRRA